MSDEVKDFRYYAERAEDHLQLSLGRTEGGLRTFIDGEAMERHVLRAQVYATLALAVTQAATDA